MQAETFARQASKALQLVFRIGHLHDTRDHLVVAMASRSVIDVAIGGIMAQNRCAPKAAFAFLKDPSNTRNTKLRVIAKSVVAGIAGESEIQTHFVD